ncbi:hypothetical protein F5141DRAFT_1192880 [Pisolithus sp. B1]|nr:hypothetical protein F5141DRAFT_1192880 [Pisolithus sp. B1]
MAEDFDLEQLVHLEQTFYDAGYTDGFAHGRIHGLIEGRALGREKGFEIWEEIGFYEGFALTWQAIYARQPGTDQRIAHHIKHLLELIQQFPRVDMEKLQRLIRSRYKALCACLGVRPTLRADLSSGDNTGEGDGPDARQNPTRQVWALEEDTKRPTMHGLSF